MLNMAQHVKLNCIIQHIPVSEVFSLETLMSNTINNKLITGEYDEKIVDEARFRFAKDVI